MRRPRHVFVSSGKVSRREVLVGAFAAVSLACTRERATLDTAGVSGSAEVTDAAWGGLAMKTVGEMASEERGGTAVVLLHGWRARGDDLMGLAHALAASKARIFVPAAPLPEPDGGRAWWRLEQSDRPEPAREDAPPQREVHVALKAARVAVQTVLRTIRERHAPDTLCVAGFSQGAMLALDVAMAAPPAVDRVAALSGLLLADSVAGLSSTLTPRPAVFVSHGRQDNVVPFRAGVRARELLERHGFNVTFRPFEGGHSIPAATKAELRRFLFGQT